MTSPLALDLRPMSTFDPTKRVDVHDQLNDRIVRWRPKLAENYRRNRREHAPGVIEWDGQLLDGWRPARQRY
jgi:hypothetical protein